MFTKIINGIRKRSVLEICIFIINIPFYAYDKYVEKKFDRYYGTDTSRQLAVQEYAFSSPNMEHACWYEAITQLFFKKMIKQVPIEFGNFVFIDIGSGKGKPLMLASDYPFKEIIGVEFSPELHQIAKKNIELFKKKAKTKGNFTLHCMDAELYNFPLKNIVLFLYNPFQGKVMLSLVKKIEAFISNSQYDVFILYRNPKCHKMFENSQFLNIVKDTNDYQIYSGIKVCK